MSYASYRVSKLMEELIQYDPDLFIIYSGHNEFLEHRTYPTYYEQPPILTKVQALMSQTRTYTGLKQFIGRMAHRVNGQASGRDLLPAEVNKILNRTIGPTSYTRANLMTEQIIHHYRINLARMVDIARSAGAGVILVKPASNLRHCSPFKSEHGDDVAEEGKGAFNLSFQRARDAYTAGDLEQAIHAIEEATRIDGRYADAYYLKGQVLYGLGRFAEAKDAFIRARDEDVCPLRALSTMISVVQDVAEKKHVPCVDFVQMTASYSQNQIPGKDVFLDHRGHEDKRHLTAGPNLERTNH